MVGACGETPIRNGSNEFMRRRNSRRFVGGAMKQSGRDPCCMRAASYLVPTAFTFARPRTAGYVTETCGGGPDQGTAKPGPEAGTQDVRRAVTGGRRGRLWWRRRAA